MRRSNQQLNKTEAEAVLLRCSSGVLAVSGENDYPYAVPLNFVYHNNKVYFHSALQGYKIDAMRKNPKVSFAVIDKDTIVSKEYTSYFRSVIIFGLVEIVEGKERYEAFKALVEKYSHDQPEESKHREINKCTGSSVYAINIEHMTGKASKELIKQ